MNVVWNSMRGGALGALSATANQGPCKDHTLSMLFPRRYGSMDRDGGGFEEGNSGWQNGKTDQSGGSESGTRMDSEREGDPGVVVVVVNMRRRKRREDERESEKRERERWKRTGEERNEGEGTATCRRRSLPGRVKVRLYGGPRDTFRSTSAGIASSLNP